MVLNFIYDIFKSLLQKNCMIFFTFLKIVLRLFFLFINIFQGVLRFTLRLVWTDMYPSPVVRIKYLISLTWSSVTRGRICCAK